MHLQKSFETFIEKKNLFLPKDGLLVAASGGIDSVVLCALCKNAGYHFSIAHCNFNLRGEESDRDEEFVKALAVTLSVNCYVQSFDTATYAKETKTGIQEAARHLRYEWFNQIITSQREMHKQLMPGPGNPSHTLKYILTAHHANDNIETLLMNFFKGTGINGLRSILPKQGNLVRPLLFAWKEEIKSYADENKLAFVEDSSNQSDKYTRNFFRNQLIPSVQKVFPQVEENLKDNIERFRDVETLYRQSILLYKNKLLESRGEELHIPVLKLQKCQPLHTIVYEIIKEFNFTTNQVNDIIHLLQGETGRYVQSATHKIIRNRNWLIITPASSPSASNIILEENDKSIDFSGGKLILERLPAQNFKISDDRLVALVDADRLVFPLLLRKWKQGDYFYPLGMKKKKKLSRFFIDQKLSLTEKQNTWLIENAGKVVWVVGRRIDERYKILPGTNNILRITVR